MPIAPSARHEELRDELVETFLAEGFLQFTLDDLAQRLRCSKGTLYALGQSKEQVMVNVVVRFWQQAAQQIEERTAAEERLDHRIVAYLHAVADVHREVSAAFMDDVARHPATNDVYLRNTEAAARRVSELIAEGSEAGLYRDVHAAFIADVVAATIGRIVRGETARATGLTNAEAYDALAELALNGIRA